MGRIYFDAEEVTTEESNGLDIDTTVIKEKSSTYTSILDLYEKDLFSDNSNNAIAKYNAGKQEYIENIEDRLFESYYISSRDTDEKMDKLFLGKDEYAVKEDIDVNNNNNAVLYSGLLVIGIIIYLFYMYIYNRKRRKKREDNGYNNNILR